MKLSSALADPKPQAPESRCGSTGSQPEAEHRRDRSTSGASRLGFLLAPDFTWCELSGGWDGAEKPLNYPQSRDEQMEDRNFPKYSEKMCLFITNKTIL